MKRISRIIFALSLLTSSLSAVAPQAAHAVSTNPTPDCTAGSTCTVTFTYTGDYYTWVVPSGITSISVDAYGASGGNSRSTALGGKGGRLQATLSTTPGTSLYFYIGGKGVDSTSTAAGVGGWNGGGDGGSYGSIYYGAGGGGASDIRTSIGTLSSRLLVAGAGGGAACNYCTTPTDDGGYGGGLSGAYSNAIASGSIAASGGTQSAGGSGNQWSTYSAAGNGSLGVGGAGAAGTAGGGGGAGYFGGGGGSWTGAGGGSSFTDVSKVTGVTHTQNVQTGNGSIAITYLNAPTPTTFSTTQSTPTNTSSAVSYSLVFSQNVNSVANADFSNAGTATGCVFSISGSSGTSFTLTVSSCSNGTLIPQVIANSVYGTVTASNGPAANALTTTPIIIDRVAPTFTAPQSYPTGVYYPGNTLTFNMAMSETVTVSGTPRIPLTIGTTTRYATYSAGSNTRTLSFTYTVAASLNDIDGDNIEMISPAELNGGSITDLAGNAMSVFTYTPPALSLTVAQPPSAPTISSITPSSGQLSVAFTAGASNGATITKFQYSTDNGSTWKDRASGTTASPLVITTVSASASALVNGTAYNIRLRGVSLAGNGDSSTAVSATPSAVVISGDSTLTTTYGQASSTGTYTSAGGTGPYTYTLSSTPSGVSISAGVVTASASTPAGTYIQNVVSTDSASQAGLKQLTITVNKAATSISISLPNSATNAALGGAVTITATVPRAGSVNFKLDGTTISGCGSASAASTTATCTWIPGALGSVSLTAVFTPTDSSNYESSTSSSLSITVVNGVSTVTLQLAGGVTEVPKGQTINIIAAIDQAGKVSFYVDGKRLAGCFNKTFSAGNATCTWKPAAQKIVSIRATLNPTNSVYNNSESTLKVLVKRRTGLR
jgi:hypothetical protein